MGLFLSTVKNKVDRKGRVSVPALFRSAVVDQSYAGIVLYRNFSLPCIEGSGMDYLQRLADSTQELAAYSPEQQEISSLVFGDARPLPFDPEGRILLPEDLLAHANITETAAFVGKGYTFQIWEPEAYAAAESAIRTRAQQSPPTLRVTPAPRPTNGGGS